MSFDGLISGTSLCRSGLCLFHYGQTLIMVYMYVCVCALCEFVCVCVSVRVLAVCGSTGKKNHDL